MSTPIIDMEITSIKSSVDQTSKLSDDYIFGLVCFKYFYNEGRFDKLDYKCSFTDGPNDGGIDVVAINELDLSRNLVLIQSKNVQDFNSKDNVKDIFTKMHSSGMNKVSKCSCKAGMDKQFVAQYDLY